LKQKGKRRNRISRHQININRRFRRGERGAGWLGGPLWSPVGKGGDNLARHQQTQFFTRHITTQNSPPALQHDILSPKLSSKPQMCHPNLKCVTYSPNLSSNPQSCHPASQLETRSSNVSSKPQMCHPNLKCVIQTSNVSS
jgi:hypothetical protein